MAGRLEGKVCVITGAAGGIGAASASLLASEGARIVGVDPVAGAPGALSLRVDVADRRRGARDVRACAGRAGARRRALQQRRHRPERRRRAEEIAAPALFLTSDESSYVNASAFLVDAGSAGRT
jgi:NAD(P)-dependent dehydrogenase (short-subunit alcohol dehydrogenase family)